MQILSITSQKGGVGKTTLAMNIAVAAAGSGVPTLIFDLDPQASATSYYDRRLINGGDNQPKVVSIQAVRLPQELKNATNDGYELAIIDTPPNVSSNAVHISQAGDFVLIPVKPSLMDLDAVRVSIEIAKSSGRPSAVVLNGCKPFGRLTHQARQFVMSQQEDGAGNIIYEGHPVLSQEIGDRVAFVHAATVGQGVLETEPDSKAAREIVALWSCIHSTLKSIRAEETSTPERSRGNV